jgi:Lon protease-like protein
MSDLLPLFPLPNVVLFPNVFLPLHVFEARYREMVADALQGDRLVGMVLLRPGWEHGYEGRPAVFPVGCVGVITHVEQLDSGRYNIVLRGVERFRILAEDHARSYRSAVIEVLPETPLGPEDRDGGSIDLASVADRGRRFRRASINSQISAGHGCFLTCQGGIESKLRSILPPVQHGRAGLHPRISTVGPVRV